jgi:ribonuclease-3
MEEEPVMAAPDIDKLQEEQQNFIIEQEKPLLSDTNQSHQKPQTDLDDLTLDDITATPHEKSREEIIAEAEAAAFSEG